MSEYLALMKSFVDILYLANFLVNTKDLISYAIPRLDEEFSPIQVVIQNEYINKLE